MYIINKKKIYKFMKIYNKQEKINIKKTKKT